MAAPQAVKPPSAKKATVMPNSAPTLNRVSLANASPLLELCPTALVFGMWDSTGPKGGLGVKFERAMVSEVMGIGASFGVKTQSRIDPIIAKAKGIAFYESRGGGWTLDEAEARVDPKTKKPVLLGKDGKASEANLGNVTPAFHKYGKGAEGPDPMEPSSIARQGQIAPGGTTIEYAEQITTLSLICLRRLRFPINGKLTAGGDQAAQILIAALGLCAATLAFESGMDLRSRCLLWPEGPMEWELLDRPGQVPRRFTLTSHEAIALLSQAAEEAKKANLPWPTEPVVLKPSTQLLELVRRSQQLAAGEAAGEEE